MPGILVGADKRMRISGAMQERLKKASRSTGIPIAQLVRSACEEAESRKESLDQDALSRFLCGLGA